MRRTRITPVLGTQEIDPRLIDPKAVFAEAFHFNNAYSAQFDGLDDYISSVSAFGSFSGPAVTNKASFAFWHRETNTTRGGYDAIFGTSTSTAWNNGFGGYWSNNSIILWWGAFSSANAISKPMSNTGSEIISNWHHYAYTYDGALSSSRAHFYFDGTLFSSANGANTTPTHSFLEIGRGQGNTFNIQGNIDEFAVWNTKISASDVAKLYAKGPSGNISPDNLVVWYRLGDLGDATGAGNVKDQSGNSNNATANNGAQFVLNVP